MQFKTAIVGFMPLLVAIVAAVPIAEVITTPLKRSDLPENCHFVNGTAASRQIYCEYTSPHANAVPIVTSNIPGVCNPEPNNPHSYRCKTAGIPTGFGVSRRDALVVPDTADSAYKFSLTCDDDGCESTHAKEKRDTAAEEAYKLSIIIELKKRGLIGGLAARDVAAEDAYKLSIVIEFKKRDEIPAIAPIEKRAQAAEEAYKLSIVIEF